MILSVDKLRVLTISILLLIFTLFIGLFDVKAFTYTLDVVKNRDVVFGGKSLSVYPYGGQTGNLEVKYDNLNHVVSCNTNTCGVEYYFNASYITNNASTQTIDIIAMTAQLDAPGYPVCSVVNGTISCIVSNPITIKGLSIYFPLTSANMNWTVNTNLIGNYTIFDIPNTTSNAISNISSDTNDIKNATSGIASSITDSNIDTNTSNNNYSGFSNTANSNMNNTPVSNLIALPITFLTGVNSAISSSCTNVNYIELFNYQLVLPCLNLADRLGSVWVIIDTICSCMLLFSIGKSLVSTFARLSDMDTNIMYECYANGKSHRGESFND